MTCVGENVKESHPLTLIGMITDSKVDPPTAVIKNFVSNVPGLAVYIFNFLQSKEVSGVRQSGYVIDAWSGMT